MSTDYQAEHGESTSSNAETSEHPLAVSTKGKGPAPSRKGSRPPEPVDERKRKKPASERTNRQLFADGVERAACTFFRHTPPPEFPVQHRTGIAALVPRIVARRTSTVLVCDCVHTGSHYWPDGDLADESGD